VSPLAATVMRGFYRRAKGCPDRLPWHRETPDPILVAAVMEREQAAGPWTWGAARACSRCGWLRTRKEITFTLICGLPC
jgi:hypothetical protein